MAQKVSWIRVERIDDLGRAVEPTFVVVLACRPDVRTDSVSRSIGG